VKIGQRWSENEMREWGIIFSRTLSPAAESFFESRLVNRCRGMEKIYLRAIIILDGKL